MTLPRIPLIQSYLQHRRWNRFRDREHLLRWQDRQVRSHLSWVHTHSPFYHEHVSPKDATDLKAWPFMDKAGMQTHFNAINTQGLDRQTLLEFALNQEKHRDFSQRFHPSLNVGLSSGTSGSRGLFITSPKEEAIWAGAAMARLSPLPPWKSQRIALLLRAGNPMYAEVQKGKVQFTYIDLLSELDTQWEALLASNPDIIVSPPSVLRTLLRHAPDKARKLHPIRICSAAETLFAEDKEELASAFRCPVHQVYQATEGLIASTCPHGTLHLHEDILRVDLEPVDGNPHIVTPVLTDFKRTTQPHIRYRIGDVLELCTDPCACGSPLHAIKTLHGRQDDILHFPASRSQQTPVPVYPDLLVRALLSADAEVQEFRIIQKPNQGLDIHLRISGNVTLAHAAVTEQLEKLAGKIGAVLPPVTYKTWQPDPSGTKRRRVRRET